jgi:hypothetical protein
MVRFGDAPANKSPAKNYLARREQRRLLFMVMTLGLAVWMTFQAAKPSTWAWLWMGQQNTEGAKSSPGAGDSDTGDYDTRLRPASDDELALDTFISPPDKEAVVDTSGKFYPGVIPDYLKSIRDHTIFRTAESDAWFNLLTVLRDASEEEIEAGSTGDAGFVQLFEQPNQYRGKLVSAQGIVKASFDLKAPKNEHDIEGYHQVWLHPAGGPTSPMVLYVLDMPEDFPSSRGEGKEIIPLHEEIEVTGFFYKNWAYRAQDQIRSVPLIVAKTIRWAPPEEKVYALPETSYVVLAVAGAAVVGIVIAVGVYFASKSGPAPALYGPAARFQAESLKRLEEENLGPEIGETLRVLAESAEGVAQPDQEAP